jgi:hypothetical protein
VPGEFRATHLMQSLATASGPYRPIVLKEAEIREVDVALTRAHAITVRVVDPWGDPLSGLLVLAKPADGRRHLPIPMNRLTDDHGRRRIYELQSGRYIVCAESDPLGLPQPAGSPGRREGFLRTCYPSAADETEAEVVRLDRSDVGELEIRMRRGRMLTISGRVFDASGAVASSALVMLSQFRSNGSSSRSVVVDTEGRFTIANVHPGDYAIEAALGGPDRPEQRRALEAGFLPVQVFTRLADDRFAGSGSLRSALVQEDRVFTLTGIFGRRTLEVVNVPRGWYVKSIRYGGKNIIDEPTEFKDSSDPSGLEVLLSNRGAAITGRVVDESGNPVSRAMVLMFRGDGSRSDVPLISSTRASSEGTFQMGPARGGDYLVVALPPSAAMLQAGEWDRIARLAAAAERISLGDFDLADVVDAVAKHRQALEAAAQPTPTAVWTSGLPPRCLTILSVKTPHAHSVLRFLSEPARQHTRANEPSSCHRIG